jgi:hypothetical protein
MVLLLRSGIHITLNYLKSLAETEFLPPLGGAQAEIKLQS